MGSVSFGLREMQRAAVPQRPSQTDLSSRTLSHWVFRSSWQPDGRSATAFRIAWTPSGVDERHPRHVERDRTTSGDGCSDRVAEERCRRDVELTRDEERRRTVKGDVEVANHTGLSCIGSRGRPVRRAPMVQTTTSPAYDCGRTRGPREMPRIHPTIRLRPARTPAGKVFRTRVREMRSDRVAVGEVPGEEPRHVARWMRRSTRL